MKKKLLFVVSSTKFFLSHRLTLAQAATAAGYEVYVATPSSRLDHQISAVGLIHHPIHLDRAGFNPLQDIRAIFSLWRLYRKIRPDIVHHVTTKPILYGGMAARFTKIPLVVNALTGLGFIFTAESSAIKVLRFFLQWGYRYVFRHKNTRVIFQNIDDRERLLRLNLLKPEQCVLIRGSGVSMSTFIPSPESSHEILVILASRMLWNKGVAEFVEAACQLKNKRINARFALVGGLDLSNPSHITEKQLQQWVNEGTVEWWGERNDMVAIFQKSHLVCLPSYREGLPRVLVEAAASARPIVTTDVPGCREVVQDQVNGFLVPVKNSVALADALEKLMVNPQLRQEMGKKGREMVEQEYALEIVIKKTLEIYDKN